MKTKTHSAVREVSFLEEELAREKGELAQMTNVLYPSAPTDEGWDEAPENPQRPPSRWPPDGNRHRDGGGPWAFGLPEVEAVALPFLFAALLLWAAAAWVVTAALADYYRNLFALVGAWILFFLLLAAGSLLLRQLAEVGFATWAGVVARRTTKEVAKHHVTRRQ
ncbi:MAG: hypothetical protein JOZ02_00690 [Acidobacteria bacterium]|nr:hypothetical protein [Acidobacteriota bacterium]